MISTVITQQEIKKASDELAENELGWMPVCNPFFNAAYGLSKLGRGHENFATTAAYVVSAAQTKALGLVHKDHATDRLYFASVDGNPILRLCKTAKLMDAVIVTLLDKLHFTAFVIPGQVGLFTMFNTAADNERETDTCVRSFLQTRTQHCIPRTPLTTITKEYGEIHLSVVSRKPNYWDNK